MELKPVSFKFLGNLGDNAWASVFEGGEDKLSLPRGKIWIVFSVESKRYISDRVSMSRSFFSFFYNSYYQESSASNFYALKTAIKRTIAEYKDDFSEMELGAASYAQKENILNVAAFGGVWAGVVRGGYFSKILDSGSDVIAASGYPREGDFFSFGTKSSFLPFTSVDFSFFLRGKKVETQGLVSLRESILSGKGNQRSAVFLINFSSKDVVLETSLSRLGSGFSERFFSVKLHRKVFFMKSKLVFLLRDLLRSRVERENKIFVKSTFRNLEEKEIQSRKLVFSLLAIVFILVFSFVGRIWKERKQKTDFLFTKFSEAMQKTEDAKKVAFTDVKSSRELLWFAKETLLLLEKEKYKAEKIAELRERIKSQEEGVLKEFTVNPEVFVDLSLLTSNFNIGGIVSDGTSIIVFDKEVGKIVKIDFDTKKTEAVSGPSDFENVQDVALYAGKVFVLTRRGFFNVEDNSKMLFRNDFGDDALVFYYAGNVYVLDRGASRIYRINSLGENFSLPQVWTAKGLNLEMNGVKDWFIDGFIWVLYEDAKILKFNRGIPERVVLKNVFPRLENIHTIYSNERAEFLYVLDKVSGRVVVFDKGGSYFAQYFSEDLKEAENIAISEIDKRLIFSKGGSKLYLISLKHL